MKPTVNRNVLAFAAMIAAMLAVGAGCGHKVGDSCKSSVDCDPNGTRSCDLSQPGGYCTIVGCDETSCPSEAACIRTFPPEEYLSPIPCDPECEDLDCEMNDDVGTDAGEPDGAADAGEAVDAGEAADAADAGEPADAADAGEPADAADAGEAVDAHERRMRQNVCAADEVCLDIGRCAKLSSEQRQCAFVCSNTGDCRGGYECRTTGVAGGQNNMLLSPNPKAVTKFCAPVPPQPPKTQ
jgi:hypothetical protein